MEPDQLLSFTPVEHPDPRVQRVGFDLTHPYVEQCWSATVGPSSTLLLRRLPVLWIDRVPAEVSASELARSLGLGAGAGVRSRLANTLERLARFGLAQPAPDGNGLDVFRQVPPLSPGQLQRAPQWTRDAHDRLFGEHLEHVGSLGRHRANVASITARLDRLQHGSGPSQSHAQALGR